MRAYSSEERLESELDDLGIAGVNLADGEHLETSLNYATDSNHQLNVMLLTDRRLIHVRGADRARSAIFASLEDIDMVEITYHKEGNGVYVWAGLSFLVAVLLWRVISNPLFSVLAALAVAAMGAYLIIEHFIAPGSRLLIIKAGSAELRYDITGDSDPHEAFEFVNRLFTIKNGGSFGGRQNGAGRPFSPR